MEEKMKDAAQQQEVIKVPFFKKLWVKIFLALLSILAVVGICYAVKSKKSEAAETVDCDEAEETATEEVVDQPAEVEAPRFEERRTRWEERNNHHFNKYHNNRK